MKFLVIVYILLFGLQTIAAQHLSEIDFRLADYRWEHRIILIFGPDKSDNKFYEQQALFSSISDGVEDRDLMVVSILNDGTSNADGQSITNESTQRLRDQFNISDDQFSILLIGKDGGEKLRSEFVLSPEYVFSVIDRMPMRQREMRDGK